MRLSDFSTLTFDCYGTLIDWESGIIAGLKSLTDRMAGPDGTAPDRDIILQAHARLESTQQRYNPSQRYSDLLATVYRRLAEEWGLHVTLDEAAAYGHRYSTGRPFRIQPLRWPISRIISGW